MPFVRSLSHPARARGREGPTGARTRCRYSSSDLRRPLVPALPRAAVPARPGSERRTRPAGPGPVRRQAYEAGTGRARGTRCWYPVLPGAVVPGARCPVPGGRGPGAGQDGYGDGGGGRSWWPVWWPEARYRGRGRPSPRTRGWARAARYGDGAVRAGGGTATGAEHRAYAGRGTPARVRGPPGPRPPGSWDPGSPDGAGASGHAAVPDADPDPGVRRGAPAFRPAPGPSPRPGCSASAGRPA